MSQRTVLIVEDEFLIRMALADALCDAGYDVIEAGTALEAIAALGSYDIDAVITDIDMPGSLNGLDLARMVSATHSNAALIVASGGHHPEAADLPDRARFVAKPYGMAMMTAMLCDMTARDHGAGYKLAV